jgi:biofilm protein TabA
MIVGTIEHILKHVDDKAATLISDFVAKASPDTEDGSYPLIGDEVFAKVLSYNTTADNNNQVEAHNQYVDIQTIISGNERVEIYKRGLLNTTEAYSDETDCEFFSPSANARIAEVILNEENSAVFFPNDAHLAALNYQTENGPIKKIVIKIYEKYFS